MNENGNTLRTVAAVAGLMLFWKMLRHGYWHAALILGPASNGHWHGYAAASALAAVTALAATIIAARRPRATFGNGIAIGVCAFASAVSLTTIAAPFLAVAQTVVLGVAFGLLILGWGQWISRENLQNTLGYLTFSYLLSFVLGIAESVLGPGQAIASSLTPIASGALLAFCSKSQASAKKEPEAHPSLPNLGTLLALLIVAGAVARGMLGVDLNPTSPTAIMSISGISVSFTAIVFALALTQKSPSRFLHTTWMFMVTVFLLGAFVVVSGAEQLIPYGRGSMLTAYTSLWFLLFIVMGRADQQGSAGSLPYFSLFAILVALSTGIAYELVPALAVIEQFSSWVMMGAAFVFVALSFAFLSKMVEPDEAMAESKRSKPAKDGESALTDIAKTYGLTPRESEVLALVPTGYTYKKIAEELFISSNTVLSHMKSIYRKTGTSGKQELLELIDHWQETHGASGF